MPIATEVEKLVKSKPFYAVAGAGDLAVKELRKLPERIQKLQGRSEEIREVAKDLPEKAKELAGKAEVYAQHFPEKARAAADQVADKATKLYDDFASHGRKVVSRASGEAALELEEVSEAAAPPHTTAPKKNNRARTPKSSTTPKA
jgi:uncharacterized coiled-coil DUF342 family protein